MCLLGVALTLLNAFTSRRDVSLATGPQSSAQREWLVAGAERPDIAQFFKRLTHGQRVAMAKAVGRYDDAPLAKLCGILLADFDAEARVALTSALKRIAAVHPDAVAEQLKQKGSFQTLAVSEALRAQGDRVLPGVAAMLANADARPAAVAFLVAAGDPAVPLLVPRLTDPSADVRLAAADALGGLRARLAVPALVKDLDAALPTERPAYLTALSAVGDPSNQGLFASILTDPTRPVSERSAVTLGLGRIGSPEAVRLLWQYAPSDEPVLAQAALSALAAVGPPSLVPPAPALLRVRLAGLIPGPAADAALRAGLNDPALRLAAVEAARGRATLQSDLAAQLAAAREDGELADALIADLAATPEGRALLLPHRSDPDLGGFIQRAFAEG